MIVVTTAMAPKRCADDSDVIRDRSFQIGNGRCGYYTIRMKVIAKGVDCLPRCDQEREGGALLQRGLIWSEAMNGV